MLLRIIEVIVGLLVLFFLLDKFVVPHVARFFAQHNQNSKGEKE